MIKPSGNTKSKTPIRSSINRTTITKGIVILSSDDFITIPKMIENKTRPSLYSFLSGLKKVFNKSGIERRDTKYLLNEAKKSNVPPSTSLYQKETR